MEKEDNTQNKEVLLNESIKKYNQNLNEIENTIKKLENNKNINIDIDIIKEMIKQSKEIQEMYKEYV